MRLRGQERLRTENVKTDITGFFTGADFVE